jgi:8-oxo-dGTP pyrophosphatase MutT (NUDIX family)
MFFYQPHCITEEQEVSGVVELSHWASRIVLLLALVWGEKEGYMLKYSMDYSKSTEVILTLRQRLEPIEHANTLRDTLEGHRPGARKASVLIGLFDQDNETHLTFIRRASTLRAHSGEIAFPGGATDLSDVSPIVTALREAQEEIGLDPSRVEVLGVMRPVFTVVSNFLITPVVAYLPEGLGTLQLQTSEVAEIILLPLRGLADPAIHHTEEWVRDAMPHTVYFYDYGSYRIWGATARMLNALLDLLRNVH